MGLSICKGTVTLSNYSTTRLLSLIPPLARFLVKAGCGRLVTLLRLGWESLCGWDFRPATVHGDDATRPVPRNPRCPLPSLHCTHRVSVPVIVKQQVFVSAKANRCPWNLGVSLLRYPTSTSSRSVFSPSIGVPQLTVALTRAAAVASFAELLPKTDPNVALTPEEFSRY